jgi:uncharacterized alpha-E superfamily protein
MAAAPEITGTETVRRTMLSRVANALYWVGRYLERAEDSARFVAFTRHYTQELRGVFRDAADSCWVVSWNLIAPHEDPGPDVTDAYWRLIYDDTLPNSVFSSVRRARENARGIRDALSSEMWEALNVLYLQLQSSAAEPRLEAAGFGRYAQVRDASQLFQGMRETTLLRGDEWRFLCLGHHLERAQITVGILEQMFGHPVLNLAREAGYRIDSLHLATTLRTCTALEAFAREGHELSSDRVAEFLILEPRLPRSITYCIQEIERSLHALSNTALDQFTNEAEQLCGRLLAELRFVRIDEIRRNGLLEYLAGLKPRLDNLAAGIGRAYYW